MINQQESRLILTAKDQVSATLERVSAALGGVSHSVSRAQTKFALLQRRTQGVRDTLNNAGNATSSAGKKMFMATTLPVGGALAYVIKSAADFEQGMNKVRALARLDKESEEFNSLRKMAIKLGEDTKFSATDAADAMGFLGMAGYKTNEILATTPHLLNLAASSGTELGRAADIASNIIGAFQISPSDSKAVKDAIDILAVTTASANVDMEMIAESMKMSASTANDYGMSLVDTASAIGLLGNVGIQGSLAGNALKVALTNLAAPASDASKLMKRLGITVETQDGKLKNFQSVIGNIAEKMEGMSQAGKIKTLNTIFGDRAMVSASVLAKAAKNGDFSKLAAGIANYSGAAERMAKTMADGTKGGIDEFMSKLETLAITIADSGILDMFNKFVASAGAIVQRLSQVNPGLLKWGTLIAIVVAAIGPFLMGLGAIISLIPMIITGISFMSATFTGLVGILALVKTGFLAVGAAMMANPIGAIIAGVATLIGLGVLLYNKWTPFRNMIDAIVEKISFVAGKVGSFFGFNSESSSPATGNPTPAGAPTKASELKQNYTSSTQTNNARVGIDFSGVMPGTKVRSEDPGGILDLALGFSGGY